MMNQSLDMLNRPPIKHIMQSYRRTTGSQTPPATLIDTMGQERAQSLFLTANEARQDSIFTQRTNKTSHCHPMTE